MICADPGTRALARAMMVEAQAIAEKLGVRFPIAVDKRIDGAAAVGAHKTSMLQDLERGRPMEIDALVTAVQEHGPAGRGADARDRRRAGAGAAAGAGGRAATAEARPTRSTGFHSPIGYCRRRSPPMFHRRRIKKQKGSAMPASLRASTRAVSLACLAGVGLLTATTALAWEPTRTVEFIVPAGTGGGADQMARMIQGVVQKNG